MDLESFTRDVLCIIQMRANRCQQVLAGVQPIPARSESSDDVEIRRDVYKTQIEQNHCRSLFKFTGINNVFICL